MELNINKEFVDVIAEKFGMFIDWSVENVYPQVMEILMRYRTYELATHGGYTIISIVLLLYTFFIVRAVIKDYDVSYNDFPEGKESYQHISRKYFNFYTNSSGNIRLEEIKFKGGVVMITALVALVIGFSMFGCNIDPFLKWLFIPEMQFYQLLVGA